MKHPLLPVALLMALGILLCEVLSGAVSVLDNPARNSAHYSNFVEKENWLLVRLTSIPEPKSKTVSVVGEVEEISGKAGATHCCKGKLLLHIAYDSCGTQLHYGDQLLLLCSLKQPTSPVVPHQFDYRIYLQRKGILYDAYISPTRYRVVGHSEKGLMSRIMSLRESLMETIRLSSLSPSQQGIAEAVLLGWNGDIDADTEERFQRAGVTHLLCVSGLHVGLVALLVGALFSFLPHSRRGRIAKGLIQLAAVLFFTLLSGMAPSTCRAALMFTFIILGRMFFGTPSTLNSIAASAIVMMAIHPSILFNVGFQLSYSAVIGIVVLTPVISEPLARRITLLSPHGTAESDRGGSHKVFRRMMRSLLLRAWQLVCVSIAAQIATAPFTLYYFHRFPVCFIVANVLVVPLASVMIGTTLLMLLFAWWPWLFNAFGKLLSLVLSFAEKVTGWVADLPFSVVDNIYFDKWMLLLSLLMLAIVTGAAIGRSSGKSPLWLLRSCLATLLVAAIAMIIYVRFVDRQCTRQRSIELYAIKGTTAMEFFAGKNSYLVCDSSLAANPDKLDFYTENNLVYHMATRRHILCYDTLFEDQNLFVANGFIDFSGRTLRVVDRQYARIKSSYRPHVERLYLCGNPYISVAELKKQYSFDTLVIGSDNSPKRTMDWIRQCDSLKMPVVSPTQCDQPHRDRLCR